MHLPHFVPKLVRSILACMATLSDIAKSLPQKPGVYLFHGGQDVIVYVGKAKNLRHRVSSYFQPGRQLEAAKLKMVEQIGRIEHIIVRTETEALLLESTLIKKHRPKYNILLKDDKYFQYIKIALNEDFPTVSTVRRVTLDGSRYFGPYTSGLSVRRTMRLLKRLFPYKSCSNPPEIPCFDWQLKRCFGHSLGPNSQARYRQVVERLIHFLEGHTGDTLKNLKQKMQAAARAKDFEQAAIERDRLQALEHVLEEQTVVSPRGHFDVLGLARQDDLAAVALFQIRQGKLVQRDSFMLQHTQAQSDSAVLAAFIEQYYSQATNHPNQVFTPVAIDPTVGNALQLTITQAQRGLKRQLVKTATENAQDYFEREHVRWLSEERRAELGLRQLTEVLKLPQPPKRIEMYDISNFQGDFAVGSMVVFENGQAQPEAYRKFRIKTIRGSNDFAMLAEVLRRRFARTSEQDWPQPDLLLLDGGKPQLSTVLQTVNNLPKNLAIGALAKQEEELFIPKRVSSIRLAHDTPGLQLLQRIRDEAHRFAISYYRQRHRKATTRSRLDDVIGLGPTNKKRLLARFGTIENIRRADDGELQKIQP